MANLKENVSIFISESEFSVLCSPEHQTLQHLVRDTQPRVPEDQPQIEAAGLARVVAVILQEGCLPVMQHVQQHRDLHQVNPTTALKSLFSSDINLSSEC